MHEHPGEKPRETGSDGQIGSWGNRTQDIKVHDE